MIDLLYFRKGIPLSTVDVQYLSVDLTGMLFNWSVNYNFLNGFDFNYLLSINYILITIG
jgi:hypothetical protein